MKQIALIGAALGALAGRALGSIGGSEMYQRTAQAHHSYRRNLLGLINRPSDPRHWHDLTDPKQMARVQAAEDRRLFRAVKLHNNTDRSIYNNRTLRNGEPNPSHQTFSPAIPDHINPFYVAK